MKNPQETTSSGLVRGFHPVFAAVLRLAVSRPFKLRELKMLGECGGLEFIINGKFFRNVRDSDRNLRTNFEDSLLKTTCGLHNLRIDFSIEA
jgi:hypothetical protein